MSVSDLKHKSKAQLNNLLREKREKLCRLRFNLVSGKLRNFREIRKTKKEIARILTLLRESRK